MSEIFLKQVNALIVSEIEPNSPAERAGVQIGDLLKQVNGRPTIDILDYRFHSAAGRLRLSIERGGTDTTISLRKRIDEDAGLTFEFDLGDKVHTCKNKCVFCFIHQQPKKMRRSLYLMDDDFRLSFMHGNYVTLTNISDEEWQRILEQKLSPLYVSVHATDPELRRLLLGRREPTPIIPQIRELAQNRIEVHAQIVLCPGLNDGDALERTLTELAAEHPVSSGKRTGVSSVAIVPVGMTRFRERLPQLQHVERDYARRMIERIEKRGPAFEAALGTRFAWLADEWYYLAERPVPPRSHYEEFPQLEDGIGTLRLFMEGTRQIARKLPERAASPISATLVTAEMPAATVQRLADRLNRIPGVEINVCVVKNDFFGGDVRVAGLLTAQDILAQLAEFEDRKSVIYLPPNCLRDETVFLDDITLDMARAESGLDLRVSGNSPRELVEALGLVSPSAQRHNRQSGWMMDDSLIAQSSAATAVLSY